MLKQIIETVELMKFLNNNLKKKVSKKLFEIEDENINEFEDEIKNIDDIIIKIKKLNFEKDKSLILENIARLRAIFLRFECNLEELHELIKQIHINIPKEDLK